MEHPALHHWVEVQDLNWPPLWEEASHTAGEVRPSLRPLQTPPWLLGGMGCLVTAPHTALTDLWQWEVASILLSGGEGPDPLARPSLTPSLWGRGEVSHYHWVGVGLLPDTGRWRGRDFPTRPFGCDPSGVEEVLGCLLTTRKRGSLQSLLILCWHR